MNIKLAKVSDCYIIRNITIETIKEIYPLYYPSGVVNFFIEYHNESNIIKDIKANMVFLLWDKQKPVATVTIKVNEICRLFVLPKFQKRGFGKQLMEFAENKIFEDYDIAQLDSSLTAKNMYLKHGYYQKSSHSIKTTNDHYLCYDVMEKDKIHNDFYDSRDFVIKENTINGEVNKETKFHYHQNNNLVWAEYSGGDIMKGCLLGMMHPDKSLDFSYLHINKALKVRVGNCHSTPILLKDGTVELHEKWHWLNGDFTEGTSILIEK